MLNKYIFILSLILLSKFAQAEETCSRVAVINYQEVLVDTSSTQKGEGLRHHLNKDPIAKNYLDIYQDTSRIKWQNAALGTLGTGLILSSFLINTDQENKKSLIVGGVSLLIINFLVARTLEFTNEENLKKSIDEYNKRNLPKIYFLQSKILDKSFLITKSWSF